jgi:hypothetical protein
VPSGDQVPGIFSAYISGLAAGTTYYVRAYATNSAGTGIGTVKSFVTSAAAVPNVTTSTVTDITQTTARGVGNIGWDGAATIIVSGFVWNTSPLPTIANNKTVDGPISAPALFSTNLTSLVAGTTYYGRAYATNSIGTSYGDDQVFTTSSIPVTTVNIAVSSNGPGNGLSGTLIFAPSIPSGEWACICIDYNQRTVQPPMGYGRAIICCNGINVSNIDTTGNIFCTNSYYGSGGGQLKINSGDIITWCNNTTASVGSCSCINISPVSESIGINVTMSGCRSSRATIP